MVGNPGVAFGIPIGGWWLQVAILSTVAVLWWRKGFLFDPGLSLIFLGGVLNLYERIVKGTVSDYLELKVINLWFNWPDVLITIGCIVYIWQNRKYFTKTNI